MTLATCTAEGKPSARIVLLKELNKEGLVFFTNYQGHKAKDILSNPYAAAILFWADLERQVRVEGQVKKATAERSDSYFKSRPQLSKLGTWASPQSSVIPNRKYLEQLMTMFNEKFKDKETERPANWGGYIIKPTLVEFWQGRESRLHDRIQYRLGNSDGWIIERLAP
jgi:pyridoxamine 5'-phosphate oxidase